jgi:hypothetical protein
LAEQIQEERDHALEDLKKAEKADSDSDLWGNDYIPALKGKFTPLGSDSIGSKVISVAIEITTKYGIDHKKIEEKNPVFIQAEIIRGRLNTLAKIYAMKTRVLHQKPDFKALHKKYLTEVPGALPMDRETLDQLKKRQEFYANCINSVGNRRNVFA